MTAEEAAVECEAYLFGCDFVCQRKIGDVACMRSIRFELPDEYDVQIRITDGVCLESNIKEYNQESLGDELIGTKGVSRGTLFDRRGGMLA